jgi:polysaccharide export outer membrane protein
MHFCRSAYLFVVCATVSASLAACSGSGPSGRDLISAGKAENAPFALVEINDQNIDIVSRWHRPSFGAMFGDYRSAVLQRIGVGDSLNITIWEAGGSGIFAPPQREGLMNAGATPATIPEQSVARDGTVQVPFAGRLKVAGRTPQQVEKLVVRRLEGKASQPQVLVTLSRNLTHSATVTGDVANGARVPLSARGDRILDVIASAGGVRVPVHEAFITVSRSGTSLSVPMQNILENPVENVYVRPGDVITVLRRPLSFTAVGATGRNAVVPFGAGGLTLEEAMGKAGGLLEHLADPTGVFVLRYEHAELARNYTNIPPYLLARNAVPVVYRLDLRKPAALFRARRFAMRDKDILYVSTAPLSELEKIARVFGQLAAPAVAAKAISKW